MGAKGAVGHAVNHQMRGLSVPILGDEAKVTERQKLLLYRVAQAASVTNAPRMADAGNMPYDPLTGSGIYTVWERRWGALLATVPVFGPIRLGFQPRGWDKVREWRPVSDEAAAIAIARWVD